MPAGSAARGPVAAGCSASTSRVPGAGAVPERGDRGRGVSRSGRPLVTAEFHGRHSSGMRGDLVANGRVVASLRWRACRDRPGPHADTAAATRRFPAAPSRPWRAPPARRAAPRMPSPPAGHGAGSSPDEHPGHREDPPEDRLCAARPLLRHRRRAARPRSSGPTTAPTACGPCSAARRRRPRPGEPDPRTGRPGDAGARGAGPAAPARLGRAGRGRRRDARPAGPRRRDRGRAAPQRRRGRAAALDLRPARPTTNGGGRRMGALRPRRAGAGARPRHRGRRRRRSRWRRPRCAPPPAPCSTWVPAAACRPCTLPSTPAPYRHRRRAARAGHGPATFALNGLDVELLDGPWLHRWPGAGSTGSCPTRRSCPARPASTTSTATPGRPATTRWPRWSARCRPPGTRRRGPVARVVAARARRRTGPTASAPGCPTASTPGSSSARSPTRRCTSAPGSATPGSTCVPRAARAQAGAWLDWLAAQKVEAVGFGFLTLRRIEGAATEPTVVVEDLPGDLVDPSARRSRAGWTASTGCARTRATPCWTRGCGWPTAWCSSGTRRPGDDGWTEAGAAVARSEGPRWRHEVDEPAAALLAGCRGALPLRELVALLALATTDRRTHSSPRRCRRCGRWSGTGCWYRSRERRCAGKPPPRVSAGWHCCHSTPAVSPCCRPERDGSA